MSAITKQISKALTAGLVLCLSSIQAFAQEERQILELNNNCTVTILNRAIQATVDGDFTMPNVPGIRSINRLF